MALNLMAKINGKESTAAIMDYSKVDEGVRGMTLILLSLLHEAIKNGQSL
jgi:hypothetical protein